MSLFIFQSMYHVSHGPMRLYKFQITPLIRRTKFENIRRNENLSIEPSNFCWPVAREIIQLVCNKSKCYVYYVPIEFHSGATILS